MKLNTIIFLLFIVINLAACQSNELLASNEIAALREIDASKQEANLFFPEEESFLIPEGQNNIVEDVNGVLTIQNPENILSLTNKTYYLPADYYPEDLVQPNVPFVFSSGEQNLMRKIAAEALEEMFADAKNEGIQLVARSGFRSYSTQKAVFQRNVNEIGFENAIKISAQPGTSEHQTGLTMDISANSVNQKLTQAFGETKEGIWLRDNAHNFGFILRYPAGKEDITKYSYEPWHFRYVGVETATVIYENGWTLEEYFEQVK